MAHSETAAWHVVAVKVRQMLDLLVNSGGLLSFQSVKAITARLLELDKIAADMEAQLARGLHANPALIVYGNPPKGGELMSRRVYAVEYQHSKDGEDYRHDCSRGVNMWALGDGAILLQRPDRKPLSREFDV